MNIIRMSGGLGNQMFQYALYMKLISQGKKVKFDDINEYRHDNARPIMLSVFGIEYPRAAWGEITKITDGSLKLSHRIRRKLTGRKSLEYKEQGFGFDPEVLKHSQAYLCGVFQSEKYFEDIAEQVRETFRFPNLDSMKLPEELMLATRKALLQIEDTQAVGIHIRRGDYLMNEEVFGGICTDKYYEGAMSYLLDKQPDSAFFIFSNEPKWARTWIDNYVEEQMSEDAFDSEELERRKSRFTVMETNTEYTGYLDLLLMSRCKHNIIANSSFSWWGAWLNENLDKIVVAPDKWLNDKLCDDVYMKGMVLVNAKGRVVKTVK